MYTQMYTHRTWSLLIFRRNAFLMSLQRNTGYVVLVCPFHIHVAKCVFIAVATTSTLKTLSSYNDRERKREGTSIM